MNSSTNPSALRSKEKITKAFLKLIKQYSYSEIITKQIILEADVSRKTFYRNFKSKEDILLSLINITIDAYLSELLGYAQLTTDVFFETILKYCYDNRDFFIFLSKNNLLHLVQYALNEKITYVHYSTHIKESAIFENVQNDDYIIRFNVGGILNVVDLWIINGMKDDQELIKKNLEAYFKNIARCL